MPFHLPSWVGPRPRPEAAVAEIRARSEAAGDWTAPPSAAMAAFLEDVVRVYPVPPDEGSEDSPWAWSPLRGTASGDIADLTLTWSGYRRASLVIAGVAERHGVVCFDPESGRMVDPPQPPVAPVSGPSHARLLAALGRALSGAGLRPSPGALELPLDDGLLLGLGLQGVLGDASRAVWVSVGLVDAVEWAAHTCSWTHDATGFDPGSSSCGVRTAATRIGWLLPDPHDHAWALDDEVDLDRCVEQVRDLVLSAVLPRVADWSVAARAGAVVLGPERSPRPSLRPCSLAPCGTRLVGLW